LDLIGSCTVIDSTNKLKYIITNIFIKCISVLSKVIDDKSFMQRLGVDGIIGRKITYIIVWGCFITCTGEKIEYFMKDD